MAQKKILIPGGKVSDWALVNAAHRLGLYVITSGTNRNAPAHQFADEYVYADYSDKEAMLQLAIDKKIDYMCSCANDFGMMSTAYVCEKLGLPGHDSYETTWTLHHKDTFKPIAEKLGIHSPVSRVFTDRDQAVEFLKNADRQMIVKPSDNVASIGVSVPRTDAEIISSVDLAFEKSKTRTVLIEPYLEGFFATVTSMIIDQKVVAFFANSSCKYPQGEVIGPEFPANERDNGGSQPALHFNDFAPSIIEDFNKIAQELKLVDGKFHCELLIAPDHTAQIFDVHRRMSGEGTPWHEWNETTGLCWEEWVVKAECGMDLSDFPVGIKQNRFFHNRNIYAPKNGIISRIVLDEYLTKHLHHGYPGKEYVLYDKFVSDHRHEPVANLKFEFDSQSEMEFIADNTVDNFYPHIRFEYKSF
ncbi:MAG: hypothetical protein J5744_05750 [Oscillospiraceae bacterium]|nr:hypothetical protein [Oscillospiraceae bacterium]